MGKHVLAQIKDQRGLVAVGIGVYEQGWCGVFCMHTLNSYRRQGYARKIFGAQCDWARAEGAKRLYLQVEQDNSIALNFYWESGFQTLYGYHYRAKENTRANRSS